MTNNFCEKYPIDKKTLEEVDDILKTEYQYHSSLTSMFDIMYQCFTKSTACFSGEAIVRVYLCLKAHGIDIFKIIEEYYHKK
jgi:hypothetical protein